MRHIKYKFQSIIFNLKKNLFKKFHLGQATHKFIYDKNKLIKKDEIQGPGVIQSSTKEKHLLHSTVQDRDEFI